MRWFWMLLASAVLAGCNAENEYSTWPCRFAYNNMIHNDATLASAMTADSKGVFCKISESGAYLVFENNQEMTSRQPKTKEEELAEFILGIHNGIIVGFQTMIDSPYGGFVGYDAQCPNCVRKTNNTLNPKFPVTMNSAGIATCSKCGRKYDLNNGGIIQNGEEGDTGLEKYLATTTGPYGYISVGTKR